MVTLGQTDPSSGVTAFCGDITHFAIFDRGLNLKDIKILSDCESDYLDLLNQGASSLLWREGTWESIFEADNETLVDALARPLGQYMDWREICRPSSTSKTVHMVPIYRRKSKDFHEQVTFSVKTQISPWTAFNFHILDLHEHWRVNTRFGQLRQGKLR